MSFEKAKTFLDKYRKEHPFVFYFLLTYLGGITLYLIIFFIWFADYNSPMALNEVGDFLAGAFSPIAFLFLYLGYRQNSEALRIQAEELRQSTEALQLQVAEMKESVEQQKLMGKIQETELEERHNAAMPFISSQGNIDVSSDLYGPSGQQFKFKIRFDNRSDNEAKNVFFYLGDDNNLPLSILSKNSNRNLSSPLTGEEITKYKSQQPFNREIYVDFENIYGRRFKSVFKLQCTFLNGSPQVFTEDLGMTKYTQPH
ncbi:hypothetical protein QLH32_11895 [Acinetobacter corruptisaponis]|uniref:Uncharacterized protein n=1 Tax=Acinetobacter corruptisaponis TaxID=3045147 RepID=A0ABY8RZP0_9GAMM|nr:hypothetical protein [Acinetobacter sp. KCTC 92772]WHP04755.1 hypothetical protein QLH32_11895 [Acinetobacter sp. KCTC 92772]